MQTEKNYGPVPDEVMVDLVTGYAINIPAEKQLPPQWWLSDPATVPRFIEMRKHYGIELTDAIWTAATGATMAEGNSKPSDLKD